MCNNYFISGEGDFEQRLFSKLFADTNVIFASRKEYVSITLSIDSVAQEGTESGILRLVLAPHSEQPNNTFFKRDLAVTIIDTSSECKGYMYIQCHC